MSHNINVGGEVQSYDFNEPSSSITVANNELQVIKKGNFLTLYIIALREAFKKKKLLRRRHWSIWEGGG